MTMILKMRVLGGGRVELLREDENSPDVPLSAISQPQGGEGAANAWYSSSSLPGRGAGTRSALLTEPKSRHEAEQTFTEQTDIGNKHTPN